jgi:hypothetical protein
MMFQRSVKSSVSSPGTSREQRQPVVVSKTGVISVRIVIGTLQVESEALTMCLELDENPNLGFVGKGEWIELLKQFHLIFCIAKNPQSCQLPCIFPRALRTQIVKYEDHILAFDIDDNSQQTLERARFGKILQPPFHDKFFAAILIIAHIAVYILRKTIKLS